jgi:hypothetical protein
MKKFTIVFLISMFIFISLDQVASAASKGDSIDHTGHVGDKIHESSMQGYRLAYHLLDLPGRDVHHLMTYIVDKNGQAITTARLGYLVVGPDGAKQKVMAMVMKDAFGGDVNFTAKGMYTIKTKAVIGDKKLLDRFTYEVK